MINSEFFFMHLSNSLAVFTQLQIVCGILFEINQSWHNTLAQGSATFFELGAKNKL